MSEVTTYHELTVLRAKVERLEAENARLREALLELNEYTMAYKARQILNAALGETNEPA